MRLLLDTHTLLWWLDGDRRMSKRARALVGREANEVCVSAASAWEITTKWRLGKLPGAADVAADVAGAVASQVFVPLSITLAHAQLAGRLTTDHRDPFDRMLAAQALVEGMPIVSNDEAFDLFGVMRLW
jgi:PIN domain nuclease of toxin-antitoxin system